MLIVKFHIKIQSGVCIAFASIIKALLFVDIIVPNFSSLALTNELRCTSTSKYTMIETSFELFFDLIDVVGKYG